MECNAVRVVDRHAHGEPGDFPMDGIQGAPGNGPPQRVERGEQRGRLGNRRGEVRDEPEIVRNSFEQRTGSRGGGRGRVDGELHGISFRRLRFALSVRCPPPPDDSPEGKGGGPSGDLRSGTMSMEQAEPASPAIGTLLRYWRGVRRKSQLELASEAMTTPRYVSFVETGRAQPSRQMVVRLARALDVPLRERNGLLVAAGYAPMYSVGSLDAARARTRRRRAHRDARTPRTVPGRRHGSRLERGARQMRARTSLFTRLLDPETIPDRANVLRLMIEPGPVQRRVANWSAVVPALLERARREAVGGVLDRHHR